MEAVVIGRNYCSRLGMIRAAGEAGCEVTVVRTLTGKKKSVSVDEKSKYVKKVLYVREKNGRELVDLLLKEFKGKKNVILLPTDDYPAGVIDQYRDELKDIFLSANINDQAGEITKWMDKDFQKKEAEKVGLHVAKGWTVEVKNGTYVLPEGITYPCFTKPQTAVKARKSCMKKCQDEAELKELLNDVASKMDALMLVEEFIEIEREYAVCGFANKDEVIMPVLIEQVKPGVTSKGVILSGSLVPLTERPEILNPLTEYMKKIGYVGLFDFDLYENSGKVYFCELNMRLGASGFAVLKAGVNLAQLFIETITSGSHQEAELTMNKKLIYLNDKVNADDLGHGVISYKTYKKNQKGIDIRFVFDENDTGPFQFFKREELKQLIRKFLKK